MFRTLVLTRIQIPLGLHALLSTAAIIVGFFLSIASPHAAAPDVTSLDLWEPQIGDRIFFDTQENVGYLIHPDGTSALFPIVTGQRRVVQYIGLTYNATTPVGDWVAKSRHIKGDRITYGKTGRFLRLYKNGDEYTHYGIHTHAYENTFFAGGTQDRFRSMGCIIVTEQIYDLIEETYELNNERLTVATRYGIGNDMIAKQ